MGRSTTGKPVSSMIGEAFPVTLQLAMMALAMAIVVGIPLGMLAGATSRPAADASASTIGLLGVSVPGFWLGTMMILLFALMLRWLPPGGFVPLHVDPIENLRHLLMPTVALGAAVTAVVTRMTRASMRRVRDEDYLRTAKAKGVPPHVVWFRHALRNAMLPVLTIAGIQAGYLLGGSVVIEQVFGLPGIGRMALQAIERRDYPLFQGIVLLIGVGFITINLAVDVLYTWFDPRIQIDDQREVA